MTPAGTLPGSVHFERTAPEMARAVAEWLAHLSSRAIGTRGRFSIALAGGSTPRETYALLASAEFAARIDWSSWWCCFGDERACPSDDPLSNYAMATATLLSRVPIDPDHIFRMPAERPDLAAAAADYAATLEREFGGPPRLDCILLGLGDNGHTASLFPGTPALEVTDTWCCRGRADYVPFDRLTLSYPAINAARCVAFLVSGGTKVDALAGVVAGTVPAARINPVHGELHWFLDAAAAG